MKIKILPFVFFIMLLLCSVAGDAQIHQNFDVICVTPSAPGKWSTYNPIPGTYPDGAWHCSDTHGTGATPGMECTGIYGTPLAFHLDTSYLMTSKLDMTSKTSPTYIRFDVKNTIVTLPAKLSLIVTTDSPMTPTTVYYDTTAGVTPVFGNQDASGWVTHEANLSGFNGSVYYVAFRYTSTESSGSIWYLDNVNLESAPILETKRVEAADLLPITIAGGGSANAITIAYHHAETGTYDLQVYDMVGKVLHEEPLKVNNHAGTHVIAGLNLARGMYIVKLGNDKNYGVARVFVQ